jgi:hypothetical protein
MYSPMYIMNYQDAVLDLIAFGIIPKTERSLHCPIGAQKT